MKINSENLWKFINELGTNEKVKFNVYYDDQYVTQIYWNGDNFEWEAGTFTSEAFFNPLYDFVEIIEEYEPFEEDKKIEKLYELYKLDSFDLASVSAWQTSNNAILKNKINEIIDKVNKIGE